MSPEQTAVYRCEDSCDAALPSRIITRDELAGVVTRICDSEDIDVPEIMTARASRTSLASADLDGYSLCFRGRTTTLLTVVHEIAHLVVGIDSHGVLFRDELIRLVRRHIGVEHAAFLHHAMSNSGLEMGPWPASARRP